MQDRYLFRGKRIDNGEWVQGNFVHSEDSEDGWETLIIPVVESNMYTDGGIRGNLGFENWFQVNKNTICQCTGLKDKNSNLIWENDIVETQCGKAVVVWDKSEWRIKWIDDLIWRKDLHYWVNDNSWRIEVIGNKFDNPELLEV